MAPVPHSHRMSCDSRCPFEARHVRLRKQKDLHATEQEWIYQALKGELTEKNSVRAQEQGALRTESSCACFQVQLSEATGHGQ